MIVFSTYDLMRKEEYRLLTEIREESGVLTTYKTAVTPKAVPHLDRLVKNHDKLVSIYGKDAVAGCERNGNSIRFDYIDGYSLADRLISALRSKDIEAFERLLREFADFVAKEENNHTPFSISKEFKEFYGDVDCGGEALRFANIDATFTNIIYVGKKPVFIDYEWSHDFLTPVKYVYYRAISQFYNKERALMDEVYGWDKLLAFFGISKEEEAAFAKMDAAFVTHVLDQKQIEASRKNAKNASYVFSALANYQSMISERDNKLEEKEAVIADREKTIHDQAVVIEGQNTTINEKDAALADREQTIHDQAVVIEGQNTTISEKDAALADRDKTIVDQGAIIRRQAASLDETNAALATTKNDLTVTKDSLANTQHNLQEAQTQLDEVRNSNGYKMLLRWYKVRDFFLPFGSRRRVVAKTFVYFLRHPIVCIKALFRGKAPQYLRLLRKDPAQAASHMDGYIENVKNVNEAPDLQLFKTSEFKPLTFPKCRHPLVSIVIPVYNQFKYTYNCLLSVLENTDKDKTPYEVIIGDDVSTDETKTIGKLIHNIVVCRNKTNTGFLLNCKNAASKAKGKYIFFLNNDTNVQPRYLSELVDYIEKHDDCGVVGSKLVYANGLLQEAGGILWKDGSAWNYGNSQNREAPEFNYVKDVDYISGAALMIRKSLWDKVGGFDERFVPAYCEDSDFCFTARKEGYRVTYIPTSVVVHFEGISNGKDLKTGLKQYQVANTKKFYEKWKDVLSNHDDNAVNVFTARDRSKGKKTILVIDHYVPHFDKDAGSRTVFGYLKLWSEMGYNVKFIGDNFYRHEPYTTELQKLGIEVLYGEKMFYHWKNWILENEKYIDYVVLNRPHISIKYIDFIKEKMHAKVYYYGHDLHALRLEREYAVTKSKGVKDEMDKFRKMEEAIFAKCDLAYYPSKIEVDYLKKHYPTLKAKVLQPYLFDEQEFVEKKNRKDLLFVGGFVHGPNVDAVKYFVNDVLPAIKAKLPKIRFHIVGSNPTEEVNALASDSVVVHGFVSDETLKNLYDTCALVVAPLRYGAGVKGKIIEAMRNGAPIVTTSCGAEGIFEAKECLAIADDPDDMAEEIIRLYEHPEEGEKLAKKANEVINKFYSIATARKIVEEDFQ